MDAGKTIERAAQLPGHIAKAEMHHGLAFVRFVGIARGHIEQLGHQHRTIVPSVERRLIKIGSQKDDLPESAHGSHDQRQIGLADFDCALHVGKIRNTHGRHTVVHRTRSAAAEVFQRPRLT